VGTYMLACAEAKKNIKKRTWLNFTLSFFSYKNNNSGCKIQVAWLENGCMGSIRLSHLLIFQDIHVRHLPLSPAGSHATTAFNSADFSNPYIYLFMFFFIASFNSTEDKILHVVMVTKESPLKSSLSALGIELSHPSMPSTVFPWLLYRAPDISGVHAAIFAFKDQVLGPVLPFNQGLYFP